MLWAVLTTCSNPRTVTGMPVRVKANQCVLKGVANGAVGEVFHIDWLPATTFVQQHDGVWVPSAPPANMYVNIRNTHTQARFPSIPDTWPASVMPVTLSRASFKFASRTVTIKGFPIVPAFGTTVHGVQGDTRDKIVVTDLRPPRFARVDRHALYVALSRLRTRAGLYWTGRKPDDADFAYFRPSEESLEEDSRLKALAAQTAVRMSI